MHTSQLAFVLAVITALQVTRPASAEDPHPDILRVMSYNIWYVFAKGEAEEAGQAWVHSQTPDVVALQELTNIAPQKLQDLAAAWEHPHSSLLKTKGFSVGLTSRWEIEVIERGLDGMHHGFLHARTNGVDYILVHLSPFRWEVRRREAEIVMARVAPLLEQGRPVIVLGDFNANSPEDRQWLDSNRKLLDSKAKSDSRHDHVANLKDGKIDYGVMQRFLDGGLCDTATGHLPETTEHRLSVPTGIWADKQTAVTTGERIDFILSSDDLFPKVKRCRIITRGPVNAISDHYPVITDFASSPF